MKVTYIQHSGFVVESEKAVFVFDYYKGELPMLEKGRKLYVFVSHSHFDHFNKKIFSWEAEHPDITFILSDDIPKKDYGVPVIFMAPSQEKRIGDIFVRTLASTDEGVAFLVHFEGQTIFHAGDLNWWHWESEGELYNQFMEKNYGRIIGKIKDEQIHAAFLPVDPRLGEAYYWGLDRFMQETKTCYVFPMHMQGQYELYDKLMRQPQTAGYRDRIIHIRERGQSFELPDEVQR